MKPASRWLWLALVLLTYRLPAADVPTAGQAVKDTTLLSEYLAGPGLSDKIVYVVRPLYRGHAYETFGAHIGPTSFEKPLARNFNAIAGSQLRVRNLRTGADRVLLEDREGAIRNPCVYYDAERILFSYRPTGETYYHLYEIRAEGTDLRQITHGPYDDIEPCYLSDGGIVFVSSRARRYVACFVSPVGLIYRCDADGGNIRLLTCNMDHDLRPWMLPDGRVLFTRWEYVDIGEGARWGDLWAMRPDGSGQALLYHRNLLNVRPVPGARQLVAVAAGKDPANRPGQLVLLDLAQDPDSAKRRLLPTSDDKNKGFTNRDPVAVSVRWIVFASPDGLELMRVPEDPDVAPRHERIVSNPTAMLSKSARTRPGRDTALFCHEPIPLVPRPREPVLPPVTDWSKTTGRLVIADINHGRPPTLDTIQPGEIKAVAVYEQLPTPVKFSDNTAGQLSVGSTWNLKRYLGTFPVEPDGSAAVEVPARRSLQLVALDAKGLGIKRMHSAFSVMPGETLSCIGCHEYRREAPRTGVTTRAMTRPASTLRVERCVPGDGIVSYVRDVQPIWDRHCVRCHDSDQWAGRLNLSASQGLSYSHSALLLVWRGLVSLPSLRGGSNPKPREIGTPASPLMGYLRGTHYQAKLTDDEFRLVRIWIDGGGLYCSHNACNDTGYPPRALLPTLFAKLDKTCASCHQQSKEFQAKHGHDGPHGNRRERFPGWRGYLVDFSAPRKSLAIRAPLAKEAGGLGWCRDADGKPVFASKDDSQLSTLAALLPKADATGRVPINSFELPGFQPIGAYLRVMQNFGALPFDFDPTRDRLDLEALDQAYYRLFYPGADDSGVPSAAVSGKGNRSRGLSRFSPPRRPNHENKLVSPPGRRPKVGRGLSPSAAKGPGPCFGQRVSAMT